MASVVARIGDKWSVLVIVLLAEGPRRFNELKRMIGGIWQRMLTLTLRGLERDGHAKRTIFPTIPPRIDYELTELGQGLAADSAAPESVFVLVPGLPRRGASSALSVHQRDL